MLISVSGHIGSGKDTIANHLVNEYGFHQLSFSSTIKDVLSALFGWDREMLEGKTPESRKQRDIIDDWWAERLGIPEFTPRKALTLIGSDLFRRYFNDNIWISALEKKLISLSLDSNVVVSDARFMIELNMLVRNKFTTICVERGERPSWFNYALKYNRSCRVEQAAMKLIALDGSEPNMFNMRIHSSEWDWVGSEFDHTLRNNGTIKELHDKIDMIINI